MCTEIDEEAEALKTALEDITNHGWKVSLYEGQDFGSPTLVMLMKTAIFENLSLLEPPNIALFDDNLGKSIDSDSKEASETAEITSTNADGTNEEIGDNGGNGSGKNLFSSSDEDSLANTNNIQIQHNSPRAKEKHSPGRDDIGQHNLIDGKRKRSEADYNLTPTKKTKTTTKKGKSPTKKQSESKLKTPKKRSPRKQSTTENIEK